MINEIFQIVIFVVFIIAFFALIFAAIFLRKENLKLRKDVAQGILDLMGLKGELEKALKNTDKQKIEETEGFLKFVSQSRDWAFQYIERVQVAIKNFQDVFHPIAVEYYKDKEKPISQDDFGKLFEAYKKLVDELPDEGKKN